MFVHVLKILTNDDAPDFDFVECLVIFKDDEKSPHNTAEVNIFLKKDKDMTLPQLIDSAIDQAAKFLSYASKVPQSEYHRQWSFE